MADQTSDSAALTDAIKVINDLIAGLGPTGYVLPAGAPATNRARAFLEKHDPNYVRPQPIEKPVSRMASVLDSASIDPYWF